MKLLPPRKVTPWRQFWERRWAELHWYTRRCSFCHWRKAIWFYAPGLEISCDECIPRGCSCNHEPKDGNWENVDLANWYDPVDSQGRKYPCCEWMHFCDRFSEVEIDPKN